MPCEYFFIIKLEFKGMASLPCDVVLQKIHLDIQDKSRNAETKALEDIRVEINRQFVGKSDKPENEAEDGVILRRSSGSFENNILLYVENIGATVNGFVEYRSIHSQKNDSLRIKIKEFQLDLPKGYEIIKNPYFKEFWHAHSEFEKMKKENNGRVDMDLQ